MTGPFGFVKGFSALIFVGRKRTTDEPFDSVGCRGVVTVVGLAVEVVVVADFQRARQIFQRSFQFK